MAKAEGRRKAKAESGTLKSEGKSTERGAFSEDQRLRQPAVVFIG